MLFLTCLHIAICSNVGQFIYYIALQIRVVDVTSVKVLNAGAAFLDATLRAFMAGPEQSGLVVGAWDATATQQVKIDIAVVGNKPAGFTYYTDGHFVLTTSGFLPIIPDLAGALNVDYQTSNYPSISQFAIRGFVGNEQALISDGLFGGDATFL